MGESPLLLVDPDAELRQSVERTAQSFSVRVLLAADARRGLELAAAAEPSCAVIALSLPEHDGLWLTAELRALPALAPMPIAVMTSGDDVLQRLRALQQVGVDVVLCKPIEPAVLVAQARALAAMATRIRERSVVSVLLNRSSIEETPLGRASAAPFVGEITAMPPATALTILELDGRTGSLEMRATGRPPLTVDVASGFVTGGALGDRPLQPVEAIREALGMKRGRFEFSPRPSRPAPPGLLPTTRHLWAAIDEAARSTLGGSELTSGPDTELCDAPPSPPSSPASVAAGSAQASRPPRRTTLLSPTVDASPRRQRSLSVGREEPPSPSAAAAPSGGRKPPRR